MGVSITDKTLNFAIVGCGKIAQRHVEHITSVGRLVSVCDTDKRRADEFANKWNVPAYYTLKELLAGPEGANVVSICTPNGLHAEHTVQALRAGYHVLCEKPMALSVHECEQMILEAEKTGQKLFVVKQNRFNPPIVEINRLLDEGLLGKVLSVELNCFWNRNEEYYKESAWKGTKALDGGALYTQFSHFIDLLCWMFGNVKKLEAYVSNGNHPYIEIDDQGVVIILFENGAIGTINFNTNAYQKNMEGSITILGTKGTVKIGGQYLNVFEYASVEGYTIPDLPKGNIANDYGAYKGSMSNHDKVYENVVEVLNNKGKISTSGIEGMKTVELISRIYQGTPWERT